jgi:hypothetical protein
MMEHLEHLEHVQKVISERCDSSAGDHWLRCSLRQQAAIQSAPAAEWGGAALEPAIGIKLMTIRRVQPTAPVARLQLRETDGNLSGLEATPIAQVVALDAIFSEMARSAALNMREYLNAAEVYMPMALKA